MNNKPMELLFDMITYLDNGAQGKFRLTSKDGKQVEIDAKKIQSFVAHKIHDFMLSSATKLDNGKAIQAFTASTDVAAITNNVWNAFQETPNYDLKWQSAFRTVPLRKGQLSWTIGNVTSGVALKLLEEGASVEYASISGTGITGSVDLYGSGISISWKTLEGRDLAGFYSAMTDFRNKRMEEYADVHYGLLATSAANTVVDYQLASTDSQLQRDIATLAKASDTIANACKDLGFGDMASAKMIVYANPSYRGRLSQALNATAQNIVNAGSLQSATLDGYNIEIMYTYNSAIPASNVLMVLPGNKIQNAVYMQEKTFEREDPSNLNWLKSSFTAFGGVVGSNAQTAQVNMAD